MKIRGRDRRQRRQRGYVAIEAVGGRGLLGGLRGVAILAPEIEDIAGAQSGVEVDRLASAGGQAVEAGARDPGIGFLQHVTRAAEAQVRQQCGARDARLRVGLNETRDRGRDIQVDLLGFLHQLRQFRRAKSAPPVQRRRRIGAVQPREFISRRKVQRRIGYITGQNAARGTRCQAKRRKPSARAIRARDRGEQAASGDRQSLAHIRPPPGQMRSRHRCEKRPVDLGMTRVETDCDQFTGVMLPVERDAILAGVSRRGQSRGTRRPPRTG